MKKSEIFIPGKKMTGSFMQGLMSNMDAFNLLSKHKGLSIYYILPFLLNIVILTGLILLTYNIIEPRLTGLFGWKTDILILSWLLKGISFILKPVLFMVISIIFMLCYTIIGSIITSPFTDYLALKVEEQVYGLNFDEPFSMGMIIKDIVRVIKNIIKLMILSMIIGFFAGFLNVIPVIGTILFMVVNFMITTFFLGFQFFDFPLERRRFGFSEKLKVLWKCKFMVMGVGTGFFVLSFVPLVGFLGLNNATIGATVCFLEHIKPTLNIEK